MIIHLLEIKTIHSDDLHTGATKRDTLNVAFESPHWFWAMVLYFSPLDDAALPLLMECVRQVVAEIGNVTEEQDFVIGT